MTLWILEVIFVSTPLTVMFTKEIERQVRSAQTIKPEKEKKKKNRQRVVRKHFHEREVNVFRRRLTGPNEWDPGPSVRVSSNFHRFTLAEQSPQRVARAFLLHPCHAKSGK